MVNPNQRFKKFNKKEEIEDFYVYDIGEQSNYHEQNEEKRNIQLSYLEKNGLSEISFNLVYRALAFCVDMVLSCVFLLVLFLVFILCFSLFVGELEFFVEVLDEIWKFKFLYIPFTIWFENFTDIRIINNFWALLVSIGQVVLIPLFFAFQETSSMRSTLGKRIFNLFVTNSNATTITFKQSFSRNVLRMIPFTLLGLVTKHKRCFHNYYNEVFLVAKNQLHLLVENNLD